MQVLVTAVGEGIGAHEVMVTVEEDGTVGDVAQVLASAIGAQVPSRAPARARDTEPAARASPWGEPHQVSAARRLPALWVDGFHCDPDTPAAAVLRGGARIAVEDSIGPYLRAGEPVGLLELRVVGGPGTGRVARLQAGHSVIGSAEGLVLSVADPAMPAQAARVSVDVQGNCQLELMPEVLGELDEEAVTAKRTWPLGSLVRIADTLIALERVQEPDAHLAPMGDGGLAYNRPPRLNPPPQRGRVIVPQEPKKGEATRFQLLSAFLPLVFGVGMYFVTKQIYMLLFCLMSPLMMVGHWASENRHTRKKYKQEVKEYKESLTTYEVEVADFCKADQRARRKGYPDPANALLIATGPRRRLWERRITDADALLLRVGLAQQRADLELAVPAASHEAEPPKPPLVRDVPVTLSVPDLGVIGVAGDRRGALGTVQWMVAQAGIMHSPRDLSVVVLSADPQAAQAWTWTHWLPHTTPQYGQGCVALIGSDSESTARRVAELLAELERRKATNEKNSFSGGNLRPDQHIMVVLDGARLLRRIPGVPQLLQDGPRNGIFALCVDEDERLLPEECQVVVSWTSRQPGHFHIRGNGMEALGDVLADQVGYEWCELAARSLAPVRDVSRDDADSSVPTSARLLTLLSMPNPTGADIEQRWRAGGKSTSAPIGVGADGTFSLDITKDGPHGLVAGTTGAGKSELLQTIIMTLAVANTPEALNFVLIDYKGGSAFADCNRLPHTVGMVTDLDAHLTERALASLKAELTRRMLMLRDGGDIKDIEDYIDARKLNPELPVMPRLMIVIDEFASLVAELPDFIAGLVDIARRGRSLGVHLILATQRPQGVVSADIRANTNLRIALRVTSADESNDVIDAPDAGAIAKSTPGRAYVRSGAEALVAVQSARIGGRRPRVGGDGPKATLTPLTWSSFARPLPRAGGDDEDDGTMVTDLAVLVDAVREGNELMGLPEPVKPWLPALPETITLEELPPVAEAVEGEVSPAAFGLTDLPAEQARAPLALDIVTGENVMIVGGPRSGRSSALRTLAGSIATTSSPKDVHLYGIDCGANALLPLVSLPHCGAVVSRDQPDRVRRLLERLLAEISRRQLLLAEQGVSSAAEQRASAPPEERLPWMVLLFDGWEGFHVAFEAYDFGRLIEVANRLFREGGAVGLKVVMTSDRTGFSGQVSSSFGDKLIVRLADPNDYNTAGLHARDVPAEMPPGRALRVTDDGVQESQIALLDADHSGQAQVAALRRITESVEGLSRREPALLRPLRVDALPVRITVREALALDPEMAPPPLAAMFAVGGDELQPMGIDLEEQGPGYVIAGPPKSGRSCTLLAAARSLLRNGTPVVLVTPRRSPLRDLQSEEGVLGVLNADSTEGDLEELTDKADGPYVVIVDDAELVYDTPLDEALEGVIRSGMDGGVGLITAGDTDSLSSQYRGFAVEARKSRNGMLLTPKSTQEGELFSVRLPSNSGSSGTPGSGLMIQSGRMIPVQCVLDD